MMGRLTCSRCEATTEANSVEEGRKRLDHSKGLIFNKPCYDGLANLIFTGKVKTPKPENPKHDVLNTVGKTKTHKKTQS